MLPDLRVTFGAMMAAAEDVFPVQQLFDAEYSFDQAGNKFAWRDVLKTLEDDAAKPTTPTTAQQQ